MFRFLKYLVLFILGYKVIKELLKDPSKDKTVPPAQGKQNILFNNQQNNSSAPSKFNDAELIDYEEVK
ncbi:MAG: hypothetical protein IPM95_11675 [Sphingobacteriales bacterium]|jgi:hypothetical protein|nr:hypothetical protein [Sphingobacteriales bacterium]